MLSIEMTPKEKRAKLTKPISLDKALKMYGVSSEDELMELFREKLNTHKKNFLKSVKRKGFKFFWFGNNH